MAVYIKSKINRFTMTIREDLDQKWLRTVIENIGSLPPVSYAPNRFRGFISPPENYDFKSLFVKTYSHTDCQHTSFKRRHFLHRLRPRYANSEGNAYINYQKKGLSTPALIGFGEEWRYGIRNRGVIIIEAINAPSVQDMLRTPDYKYWINTAFETITQIHKAGITHGDANLVNFIADNNRVLAIDIENSRQITQKKQLSDLVNIIKSYFLEYEERKIICENLTKYENAGLTLPIQSGQLIEKAKIKADKYKKV